MAKAGRRRSKPINPCMQRIMDRYNVPDLKELSVKRGSPYSTLRNYAEINGSHQVMEALLRDSHLFEMPVEKFMLELLGYSSLEEFQKAMRERIEAS